MLLLTVEDSWWKIMSANVLYQYMTAQVKKGCGRLAVKEKRAGLGRR